ncbi:major facilitator superfamily domain-containing protein [Jimgerdemannia flammicorona]|uniref:Major facilitator superfamily domain-containing protein n=1 Tax=Jimgerdemannia flammicorona TaxID=994334 RepID=A0A433DE73_9FUNG|nr:major facilitator superfamily domain-containing protein [Jimgerdemannia flammicorona]
MFQSTSCELTFLLIRTSQSSPTTHTRTMNFRFSSPLVQVIIVGLVCFCCPGMFNALNGLGAGGRIGADVSLVDKANSALYSCFAIIGFFAGSVNNILGFKLTLFFGTIGYVVYAGSLWSYDRNQNDAFVIAAGALLGASAGLLWTAQGCVMMSYPEEKDKGKYVSIFWAIFNLGAVLGSIIPLALNIENKSSGGVSDGTYIAFMIIMMFGILLILLLKPPNKVTRDDGTPVTLVVSTDWRSELKSIVLLLGNWRMVLLIPMFLGSNWFYAYQFGINAIYFDVPTRALNGTMAAQIFGSIAMGWFLDSKFLNRRGRGLAGLAIMGTLFCGVWAGGLAFQLGFERGENLGVGWSDPRFPGPFVLYFSYGMMDAIYQTYCYWLMGALTNDAAALSRYAGFYKGIQSAGGAFSFAIDSVSTPLVIELAISWGLLGLSVPCAFLVARTVTETNYGRESDVPVPGDVEMEVGKAKAEEVQASGSVGKDRSGLAV